jgi:ATP-binding cassette subfamily F protein 3
VAEARKPFEKRIRGIEEELEKLERERAETEAWLASGEAYDETNRERLKELVQRRGEVASRIAVLEEDWLWTQANMESEVNRARE